MVPNERFIRSNATGCESLHRQRPNWTMFGSVIFRYGADVGKVFPVDVYPIRCRHVTGEHLRAFCCTDDVLVTCKKVVVSARKFVDARTRLCLFEERVRVETVFSGAKLILITHKCLQLRWMSSATTRAPVAGGHQARGAPDPARATGVVAFTRPARGTCATAPAGAGLGAFIFSSLLVRAFRAPAAAQVPSVSGLNSCSTSSLEVIRPCCRVYSRNFDKVASLDLMP